jgi:hypothetical protein
MALKVSGCYCVGKHRWRSLWFAGLCLSKSVEGAQSQHPKENFLHVSIVFILKK